MSKKESEFERYDRMKKLERENEAQKRKNYEFFEDDAKNKGRGKTKSNFVYQKKGKTKSFDIYEEEYEYMSN